MVSVTFVSSWNSRCGIAVYSKLLVEQLKRLADVQIIEVSGGSLKFFWKGLRVAGYGGIVHVQFSLGVFPALKVCKRIELVDFGAYLFYHGLKLRGIKPVSTIHEVPDTSVLNGKIGGFYMKRLLNLVFNYSKRLIVLTEKAKADLITAYGVDAEKIFVIPLGCLENPVTPDKAECKRRLGLEDKTVLLASGFVSWNHGLDLAISILPKLPANVHLVIAGGNRTNDTLKYYQNLKGTINSFGCAGRVCFVEDYPLPSHVWGAADVAVLPHRVAKECLTLRFHVSYGTPIVASDIECFKSINDMYGCLELFSSGNSFDLYCKLERVLQDSGYRESLGVMGERLRFENRWSVIAGRHFGVYQADVGASNSVTANLRTKKVTKT